MNTNAKLLVHLLYKRFKKRHVLSPEQIRQLADRPRGSSAYTLADFDSFILYRLYVEQPYRLLKSYKEWLLYFTETEVSKSTIAAFFNKGFPYKGTLVRPNLVPYDKYTLCNEIRAYELIHFGSSLVMRRVSRAKSFGVRKYGGIRSLVTCRPIRLALTSVIIFSHWTLFDEWGERSSCLFPYPPTQQWCCWVLPNSPRCRPRIFGRVWCACFGQCGNTFKRNGAHVHVLFLPTRSPEWNLIELVWRPLVSSLFSNPTAVAVQKFGNTNTTTAYVAQEILEDFTFDNVRGCFRACFDFLAQSLHEECVINLYAT